MSATSLHLHPNGFAHLHGPLHVTVRRGTMWLTVDGDPDDHVLERGQHLDVPAGGHALVQALGHPACVTVESAATAHWWQRFTAPAGAWS